MVQTKKFEQTFLNEYFALNLHEHDVKRRGRLKLAIELIKSNLLWTYFASYTLAPIEEQERNN